MSRTGDLYKNLNQYQGYNESLSPQAYGAFMNTGQGFQSRMGQMLNPGQYSASQNNAGQAADQSMAQAFDLNAPEQYGAAYGDLGAARGDTANARGYINSLSPGYTAEEANKQRYAAMAPMAGAYGDAGEQVRNNAARTGQSAGVGATLGQFARQKGEAMSQASAATEGRIADARRQDSLAKANLMPLPAQMSLNTSQGELGVQGSRQNAQGLYSLPAQINLGLGGQELNAEQASLAPMSQYGNMFSDTNQAVGHSIDIRNSKSQQQNPWAAALRTGLTMGAQQLGAKASR